MNTRRLADAGPAAHGTAAPAAVQAAFDHAAGSYDEDFSESIIGRLQRAAIWRQIDRLFQPGDQVLDLGCGTAVDAIYLAGRGVRVHGIDISPEMIESARRRVREHGLEGWVTSEVLRIEDLERWPAGRKPSISNRVTEVKSPPFVERQQTDQVERDREPSEDTRFDGVLSNFGALNCVSDLRPLARILSNLLRPGGRVAICVMNRSCLWEVGYYTVKGEFRKATRRLRPGRARASLGSPQSFPVYYHNRRQLIVAFAADFRLRAVSGIGVFVPPSYLEAWAKRVPAWMRVLDQMDRMVGRWPGFRSLGDHQLLIFEKKGKRQVGAQRAVPTAEQARSLAMSRTPRACESRPQ